MDFDNDFDMINNSKQDSKGQKFSEVLSQRLFDDEDMQTLYRYFVIQRNKTIFSAKKKYFFNIEECLYRNFVFQRNFCFLLLFSKIKI